MKSLTVTLLLAACTPADPACSEALAKEVSIENTLSTIHAELAHLKELAAETASRMPDTAPQSLRCPPNTDQGELAAALQRAAVAERNLIEFKARARHAMETWRDPHGTYDQALGEIEALAQED